VKYAETNLNKNSEDVNKNIGEPKVGASDKGSVSGEMQGSKIGVENGTTGGDDSISLNMTL
jgi:hypothetical protein